MKKENIVLFVLIFITALFLACLITNYDYDIFARLEVGEIFFKLHTILKHDPFSYTPTLYWFDHEWGSGVVFYAFLKLFGPASLIIIQALLFSGTTFLILKHYKNIKYPLIIAALFLVILHNKAGQLVRCQGFTFLFTALTLYILEKFRERDSKLIWFIPAIIAIWCNLHGGVVAGLGILSVYTLFFTIQRKNNALKLLFVTFLSYAALLINPYGIRYLAYLYYTITLPRNFIEDWLCLFNPLVFFRNIPFIIIMITILICKICRNFQIKKFSIYEYSIIIITLILGIVHIKNLSLATIVLFTFASSDLDYYLDKIKYTKTFHKSLYLVITLLSITIPFTIGTTRATPYRFPLSEVEFLKINNIKGNILAPFEDAGYVSYKLYPNNKIFIDGRYDGVYPMKIVYEYMSFITNYGSDWTNAIKNYPTDIIIINKSEKGYQALKEKQHSEWKEIYTSDNNSVFVKRKNAKSFYKEPIYDINYYRMNLFKTDFIKYIKKEKND